MGFKKVFIIIIWLFISQVILSQVNQDISFTIEQDTLYFMGNNDIKDCFFYNNYFTNNIILKIKNNTDKKKFIPINFSELNFAGKLKTETEDIKKYREVFIGSTFLTPVINILDENKKLITIESRHTCYNGIENLIDYKEPIKSNTNLENCLMLNNKFDEKDSLKDDSYIETFEYLINNFIVIGAYQEVIFDIKITLNRYSDRVYLSLEKNKTYTMQMFYFNYEEFKENISPRILDYFEKKGYKMWTGEVQSNTVKLISFDRLKCCK